MFASSLALSALLAPLAPAQECVPMQGQVTPPAITCDDGTSFYDEYGRFNPRCHVDGYSLYDKYSWPERLDHCFVDGIENWNFNGECGPIAVQDTCDSLAECAAAWISCKGVFICSNDDFPCEWGMCVDEDTAQ